MEYARNLELCGWQRWGVDGTWHAPDEDGSGIIVTAETAEEAWDLEMRRQIEDAGWRYRAPSDTWCKPDPLRLEMPYEAADVEDAWQMESSGDAEWDMDR